MRDHPFKMLANFHDFWPLPPYHRQFFTTIRRQIWQIFDTSPPKQCRRLKWMVPKMMMQNIASKSSLALSMYLDSWWINTFLENNQVRIQVRIKPDIFLRFSYPEHLSRFKPENHLLNAARSLSSNLSGPPRVSQSGVELENFFECDFMASDDAYGSYKTYGKVRLKFGPL